MVTTYQPTYLPTYRCVTCYNRRSTVSSVAKSGVKPEVSVITCFFTTCFHTIVYFSNHQPSVQRAAIAIETQPFPFPFSFFNIEIRPTTNTNENQYGGWMMAWVGIRTAEKGHVVAAVQNA